jgi:hypothetical protein
VARAQGGDHTPTLDGALHLLCYSDTKDVLQLVIHLVNSVGGGCGQSV